MVEEKVEDKNKWIKTFAFFSVLILALFRYPTAVEVVVFIGMVITIHEMGHFLVAKASGIRVEVFSLGFGAPLVSFERGGTRYQIAAIPLGGYVKPAGEFEETEESPSKNAPDELSNKPQIDAVPLGDSVKSAGEFEKVEGSQKKHAPDEFLGKPWYIRGAVLLAGPMMNFIAPIFILFFLYIIVGRPFFIAPPLVTSVSVGSAAEEFGIKMGDQIIKVDGHWASNTASLSKLVDSAARNHPGKETQFVLLRDGKQLALGVLSRLDKDAGLYRLGIGINPGPPPQRRIIKSIIPGTPAEKSGFRVGDTILSVDGKLLRQGTDFPQLFFNAKEDKVGMVTIEVARAGQTLSLKAAKEQPVPESMKDKLVGIIGLDFEFDSSVMGNAGKQYEKLGLIQASKYAPADVIISIAIMVEGLVDLFKGRMNLKESVSGPVAIARMAHQQAEVGLVPMILFMVSISLILGVMNLLPLPLLDGGTFVLCVIEGIRGKALSVKTQGILQTISGALLIALVLFATYNDILNYFHSILNK